MTYFSRVEHAYTVQGRGCVIVPVTPPPDLDFRLYALDQIQLRYFSWPHRRVCRPEGHAETATKNHPVTESGRETETGRKAAKVGFDSRGGTAMLHTR